MEKFTTLTGVAAPLPAINVDTDQIIPKQFLTTIKRTGLSKGLFFDLRFAPDGTVKPDFVLNQLAYKDAKILVTGLNFGCGSSREHAPWALMDYGIRCVIAESFADIFYNNCLQNGVLPAIVAASDAALLIKAVTEQPGLSLTVDLPTQTISGTVVPISFTITEDRKRNLLAGLDAIGLTLEKEQLIAAYEQKNRAEKPWLWPEQTNK